MKTTTRIILALAALALAACGPIPADTTAAPLNTPGDGRYIDYVNTDIHWRMFAADYGHR